MPKTILTGVDASSTALTAAEKAAELADGLGAELHVISSYRLSRSRVAEEMTSYETLRDNFAHAAQEVAESVATALRESHPSLTVHASAVDGEPAEALVRLAGELDADTIVVGNRRVQGMSRILGSIANKVAADAPCDLHIVNTTGR